jgi:hypothetical protein
MGRAPRSIDIDIDRSIDCPMPIVGSHVRTGIIKPTSTSTRTTHTALTTRSSTICLYIVVDGWCMGARGRGRGHGCVYRYTYHPHIDALGGRACVI